MSQSGFTPIQLYRSATPGAVPLAGNLAPGELAINTADQKLFFENASGTVVASVPFNTTGILGVANGGTGASTLTSGYLLKGNGASAVSSSVLYENGGYLGIGTTGPVVLFDAQQTLNGSGGISYTNLSTGASSAASITAEAGGSYLTLNVTRATGVVQFRGVTATTLNQDFTTQIFRSTGGSEYMRITSAGDVGIGTSAPVGRLNVRGEDTSNVIGSSTASINITNFDSGAFGRTANLNFTIDNGNLTSRRLATIAAVYTGFSGGSTAGALAFATQFNGSLNERMRIVEAGNVGIGTSAPAYQLDVFATGNISGQFKTSGSINALFLADAGTTAETLYVGTVGNDFRVVTGSNERMRVTSAGNVGIGTTAPIAPLDISANLGTFSATGNSILRLNNAASNGQSPLDFIVNGTLRGRIRADFVGSLNYVVNGGGHYFHVGGDSGVGAVRMLINSSGNVGIGTETPAEKLDVVGAAFVHSDSPTGIASLTLQNDSTAANTTKSLTLEFRGKDTVGTLKSTGFIKSIPNDQDHVNDSMLFGVRGGDASAERMRITSAGAVLIGTTSDAGVATNTTKLIGGIFATVRSSLSVASATPTTIVTLPSGDGIYIVSTALSASTDPANYNETAIVSISGSTSSIAILVNASVVSLTMSGLNLQVTQNQGATQTMQFSVLRIL